MVLSYCLTYVGQIGSCGL
jgi:tubulin gamma